DCLHFILSIGLELQIPDEWDIENVSSIINLNNGVLGNFNNIFQNVFNDMDIHEWFEAMENFLGMGQTLGFTEEQIEQAYLDKNKINHERQANNY
ncbi:dUTP diphosphatase, partial [Oceanobacillus massiliensis]|uniref:dUTP diphosphatase n=1 Tax=Oceanobacillus massiliensis TaxID=1465765 RepID=UPI00028A4142